MDISGGLIDDIHFIFLIDMILPLTKYFFDVVYYFKKFMRWMIKKGFC